MEPINLLSYNLKSHAAYPELTNLIKTHDLDILCLQECDKDNLTASVAGLNLAAKTTTGTLGLAIYSNNDRFCVRDRTSIALCLSVYEQLHVQDRERLLVVELLDNTNNQSFFVASFHATHLIATNHLRRRQVRAALKILNTLSGKNPAVLTGDFNYPFFHNKLKRTTHDSNFDLLIPSAPTFSGRKFKGQFDMAATSRLATNINVLPFGVSDHAPILIRMTDMQQSVRLMSRS